MRTPVLLFMLALASPLHAATTVTVAQLEQFLTSSRAARLSDSEVAERLSGVNLSEELTSRSLARVLAEYSPGPETAQQIELLATASMLEPPPAVELPNKPTPDQATQEGIIAAARDYAAHALHILPDLLATRDTRSFTNLPVDATKKHQKPRIEMHFAGEVRREIAVRKGKEVSSTLAGSEESDDAELSSGLSSWGEFGAMLAVVLGDSSDRSLHWRRWQMSESGGRLAVFGYEIARPDSHYTVDFCCYRESEDDPTEHSFRDRPAYHGEVYVDPANGEIDRITVDAELAESDPVTRSAIGVQYGHVTIGGRSYMCPVRSVAITELYNTAVKKIDGIGIERHLNDVEFTNYHKFGSTARILSSAN